MPITELVFPAFKKDSQSVAELKQNERQILQSFSGAADLIGVFRGPLIGENGATVDPSLPYEHRMPLFLTRVTLEWANAAAFHAFYPNSDQYQAFVKKVKPFVTAPATPQLYEAGGQSTACTSSNITQMIKVKSNQTTEEAWKRLEGTIEELLTDKPHFYHANGIENDEGVFLGLIGWKSLQEYEKVGKNSSFLKRVKELNNDEEVQNIISQLTLE
ncbi:hypothetical protein POJ06DRAFT_238935 [Lipomyces tetrasporus]|uniref:Uncharacterized protein n=1 Tax=Lipomyces tetrasporus TaxID=54092 RepID=A0AAD7QQB3_9ASCO|nr:uncharacterized protein POJ06DRAFT_238935 [Lipomyces tetrasporus]KAJ8099021.1 hypothetical protein POJ06DRAFT_238935 [Lipomyces tetrasporus]